MFETHKAIKTISFAELTKQVHLINDMILSDMIYEDVDTTEAVIFSKHLLATKSWFARISYANKKRYLLAFLQELRSAWALSLLLKSMWNCQPKDAVLSVSERNLYTSYDQVPLDHNRTALPMPTLAQVMKNDRIWFVSLEPEFQALVLSELLTVAGGPAMWEVLQRARRLYDRYHDELLKDLQECVVINDTLHEKPQLDANLATWNVTIKAMRDSLKLEELEMTFNDGTKRKIWKVNRVKPEVIETMDFVQLLPSFIGKKILSYLPYGQLADYARVNKYWAYLVDEFRADQLARTKIDADFERLHEVLLRHDTSLDVFVLPSDQIGLSSSVGISVQAQSHKSRMPLPSMKASEKSGGAYSLRYMISKKLNKPTVIRKPILNMLDLSERLERRGASDENIWKWCDCILAHARKHKKCKEKTEQYGVLALGNVHFPCPLMKNSIEIPLIPPLYVDPIMSTSAKPRKNMSDSCVTNIPNKKNKRYSLWTRDVSSLYHVLKIPSYLHPHPT